jgi:hypothetical protein
MGFGKGTRAKTKKTEITMPPVDKGQFLLSAPSSE